MKTKTINLHSFDELSEKAKQRAIEELRPIDNPWQAENEESLKAFVKIFPVNLNRSNGFTFIGDNAELSGWRLARYIWNNYRKYIYVPKQYWICEGRPNTVGVNSKHRDSKILIVEDGCPLSGYYIDNEILQPLFDFMRKPSPRVTFEDLMNDCYESWRIAIEKDWEYQNSDAAIIETIKANGYTFRENGTLENE